MKATAAISNGLENSPPALEKPVQRLDRHDLEHFVDGLMNEGLSPRSVARTVAAVRGFYRFAVLTQHLSTNPADDLQAPRAWPALPKFLGVEEVERLIKQPDVATPRGLRDRALIEVLYATGLRVSELIHLRASDLNLEAGYLSTTGKGNKQRIVPIGDQAAEWLMKYIREGRPGADRQARVAVAVRQRQAGEQPVARGILENPQRLRPEGGAAAHAEPARAAPFVCHAPARARRRSAIDPDDAGPCRSVDDADLHARPRGAAARGL